MCNWTDCSGFNVMTPGQLIMTNEFSGDIRDVCIVIGAGLVFVSVITRWFVAELGVITPKLTVEGEADRIGSLELRAVTAGMVAPPPQLIINSARRIIKSEVE